MLLRDVETGDVGAYIRMRCDPAMMAELGGPQSPEDMPDKVRRDVLEVQADAARIRMIVLDPAKPAEVAGTVAVWRHLDHGRPLVEIGWMVLPEFQGRGLGKAAVGAALAETRDDGRWGEVHAFPSVTNAASNGICRAVGFRFVAEEAIEFAGQQFRSNHWVIDPASDLKIHSPG